MEKNTQDFSGLKRQDQAHSDASIRLISSWREYYGEQFLKSQTTLSENEREEFPFILSSFSDFCYIHHLEKPGQWTQSSVKDVCVNIMPKVVFAEPSFFKAVVPALTLFLQWAKMNKVLTNTKPLQQALKSSEKVMLQNSTDVDRWGLAKTLIATAKTQGYNTENRRAIEAFLARQQPPLFTSEDEDVIRPKQRHELQTLDNIIGELRYVLAGYPKAAVELVIARREEITPLLLDLLKDAITNYESVTENDIGHIHAMFLLAQFREKQAFPLAIEIASLPEGWPENLLGEIITTDLHRILGSVYDGNLEVLKRMIENPDLDEWSRGAALESLLVLVKAGVLQRDAMMGYLKTLFKHLVFTDDEFATNQLIDVCCDLYPEEVYGEIKVSFERYMVEFGWSDMDWVDSIMQMSKDQVLRKYLYEDPYYDLIENAIDEMSDWVCFREEGPESCLHQHTHQERDHSVLSHQSRPKAGRNEPCPCGSGIKYKKCCGDPVQVLH